MDSLPYFSSQLMSHSNGDQNDSKRFHTRKKIFHLWGNTSFAFLRILRKDKTDNNWQGAQSSKHFKLYCRMVEWCVQKYPRWSQVKLPAGTDKIIFR